MDRNSSMASYAAVPAVAPREGGVDRNTDVPGLLGRFVEVAPREGGVDRNDWPYASTGNGRCRPPRGGRGSQLLGQCLETDATASPPARGAWIATARRSPKWRPGSVAPREGGVDRNIARLMPSPRAWVAPREGGVDRNIIPSQGTRPAECRPPRGGRGSQRRSRRPRGSARRRPPRGGRGSQPVEGVRFDLARVSPPARGAWIATCRRGTGSRRARVAPREGGVDRNIRREPCLLAGACRPPRGGRGSQLIGEVRQGRLRWVAPREGGVDRNRFPAPSLPCQRMSPPARGAWIATTNASAPLSSQAVAPREGGVDRNTPP